LMGTSIHGTVEEQECGGKLEAEDTGVMELIQTGIGISNGEELVHQVANVEILTVAQDLFLKLRCTMLPTICPATEIGWQGTWTYMLTVSCG